MTTLVANSLQKLRTAIESQPLEDRFKGIDPFDGLNSPLINKTFLGRSRFIRLAWVQFFKRSFINFRPIAGIARRENPQALALFLSAYCKIYSFEASKEVLNSINFLARRIISLEQKGWSGACWSYPFPWQARAFYQSAETPLIIPTAYCFNALLDAYEITKNNDYKNVALTVADFIIHDLNRTGNDELFTFSYSPDDNSVVYNASLMSSQVLSRCFFYTKKEEFRLLAGQSVKCCVESQQADGSWTYGDKTYHNWIDSFHSGYNLICLQDYMNYCEDSAVQGSITLGFKYYISAFFDSQGFSWYYNKKKYPLDLNNSAQLIVTLFKLDSFAKYKDLTESVLNLTINKMQSTKGWFYYQKHKLYLNKIIYLRWSNAWMFYALVLFQSNAKKS